MANEYTSGQKLQGIGAILGGTVPKFQQEMQQLDEARMKAMYQDAGAAYQMLGSNNYGGIIDLANDRLRILQRLPGSDPSDTMQVLELAQAAQSGNPQAPAQLEQILGAANQRGIDLGYTQSTISQMPATFQSRHMMALAAGFSEGSPEYQDFMARGGLDESTPGITRYRNGVAVQYSRSGKATVVDENQQIVTGQQARAAIDRGLESGIAEQGAIAQARGEGTGVADRASDLIARGISAAESLPTMNRAIELLGMDTVETGGLNRFKLAAKNFFGVTGEDEGEISNLLGKAVLGQLRETFGAAFTAKEGEKLEDIDAGFGKNKVTNLRLLKNARDIATSTARRAQRAAVRAGDDDAADDIQEFLDGMYNLGISLESEAGAIDIPRNADGIFMPTTDEQFDAIPIGSEFIDPDDNELNVKFR
jgi:hypothetical protein